MREVLDELLGWWRAGEPSAWPPSSRPGARRPRPAGASMLVGPDGEAVGSVSGGCVEGAVYELASRSSPTACRCCSATASATTTPSPSGLTCGGILDVFVERVDPLTFPELGQVAADVEAGRPVAVCTVIEHPDPALVGRRLVVRPEATPTPPCAGSAGWSPRGRRRRRGRRPRAARRRPHRDADLRPGRRAPRRGDAGLRRRRTRRSRGCSSSARSTSPPRSRGWVVPRLPRDGLRRPARVRHATRFPDADEVVVQWPHQYLRAEADAGRVDERSVLAVLTHDPKFDVPLLEVALRLDVAYVGAMGSRRTHDDRGQAAAGGGAERRRRWRG